MNPSEACHRLAEPAGPGEPAGGWPWQTGASIRGGCWTEFDRHPRSRAAAVDLPSFSRPRRRFNDRPGPTAPKPGPVDPVCRGLGACRPPAGDGGPTGKAAGHQGSTGGAHPGRRGRLLAQPSALPHCRRQHILLLGAGQPARRSWVRAEVSRHRRWEPAPAHRGQESSRPPYYYILSWNGDWLRPGWVNVSARSEARTGWRRPALTSHRGGADHHPGPDPTLQTRLGSVEGFIHLNHESA
jgi:hypothetical protein